MPFANKFRAMMDFPFPGESVGPFTVEQVSVGCDPAGSGRYTYPISLVLRGKGGQQGVKAALRELLTARRTTFSAYGNGYQLWFARPQIESLGGRRYRVTVEGAGARVALKAELHRFAEYLEERRALAGGGAELVEEYLEGYRGDVRRLVGRYYRKLRKIEGTSRALP
jgi:hypothetical protein